jgi:hypothetical protein
MRNAVALHGLGRKCALLSVVMVDAERQSLGICPYSARARAAACEQEPLRDYLVTRKFTHPMLRWDRLGSVGLA